MNFVPIDYDEYEVYNGMIKEFDIHICGHYGMVTSGIKIEYEDAEGQINSFCFMHNYNMKKLIGELICVICDLTDKIEDDYISVGKSLKDVPIRILMNDNEVCGIANFMKNKSFLIKDFLEGQK